jgi:hypothetical protein
VAARVIMPRRPSHIRPSNSIRLPCYTISFPVSSRASTLRDEPTMELRGGFIKHAASAKPSCVKLRDSRVRLCCPPIPENLIPSLVLSHLLSCARSKVPYGVSRWVNIKRSLRWRRLISRPARGTGRKPHPPSPPTSGSAAMESKDKIGRFQFFCSSARPAPTGCVSSSTHKPGVSIKRKAPLGLRQPTSVH